MSAGVSRGIQPRASVARATRHHARRRHDDDDDGRMSASFAVASPRGGSRGYPPATVNAPPCTLHVPCAVAATATSTTGNLQTKKLEKAHTHTHTKRKRETEKSFTATNRDTEIITYAYSFGQLPDNRGLKTGAPRILLSSPFAPQS